jgi:hypothetical protein
MRWDVLLLSVLPYSWGKAEIRGCSLFGLETELKQIDCSWVHPSSFYIEELGKQDFNYLRIPFSGEYVRNNNFQVMDEIFESASRWNMSICLDWHRNINANQDDWLEHVDLNEYYRLYEIIINRYKHHSILEMVSLFNEYKGNNEVFWQEQMGQVVSHFEEKYPQRFLWLIGCPQWSSQCNNMDWSHYPFANRIYVDHHKYFFQYPNDPKGWDASFYKNHKQVIIGEWGYFSDRPEQVQWANAFVNWMLQNNITNTFFWVSVSNSGDTGGMWKQCEVFEETKYQLLRKLWGLTNLRRSMQ